MKHRWSSFRVQIKGHGSYNGHHIIREFQNNSLSYLFVCLPKRKVWSRRDGGRDGRFLVLLCRRFLPSGLKRDPYPSFTPLGTLCDLRG